MDAYISEIVVVIDGKHADDMQEMVTRLHAAGVDIGRIDHDQGIVEGCVDASLVKEIDAMPGVEYVRTVFTYAANYPPGHARDKDGI
ncbi:MAG: hypothetical protein ACREJC_08760 [Tepidisphaeraceae bacterium]